MIKRFSSLGRHGFKKLEGVRMAREVGNILSLSYKKEAGEQSVGVVVSKQVSRSAVVRNRIKRQLRGAVRTCIGEVDGIIVVRAKKAAAQAKYQQLLEEMEALLARATKM